MHIHTEFGRKNLMTVLQLNPPIPVFVIDKGEGLAHAIIDYGCEMHLYWVVALDSNGEFLTLPNPKIRAQKNVTMGRMIDDLSKGVPKYEAGEYIWPVNKDAGNHCL